MKTTDVKVSKFKWDLVTLVMVARSLEQEVQRHGYHVAIGGGCVMSGASDQDADIFFYVSKTLQPRSITGLFSAIRAFGFDSIEMAGEYHPDDTKMTFSCKYEGRRIDFFILGTGYTAEEDEFREKHFLTNMPAQLPKGDFNMPPGVKASDIPGNRPEDEPCWHCPECDNQHEGERSDYDFCPSCNCPLK